MIKLNPTDTETIKKAIVAEIKYSYIDIDGKTSCFSKFILKELRRIKKNDNKNPDWGHLIELFEYYPMDGTPERMYAVKRLLGALEEASSETIDKKDDPSKMDIMYVKGVGPKMARLFAKLGIYRASDLLFYYPKKYLDYSKRTLIKDLREDEDVTIIGRIKKINVFKSPRKPVCIVTITISDGTGNLNLKKFYRGSNPYIVKSYLEQYREGADVIISGTTRFDTYSSGMTLDKYAITIIDAEMEKGEKESLNSDRIVPVYASTEGLHPNNLRRVIYAALDRFLSLVKDPLSKDIIEKYNLIDKKTALREIHFPQDQESLSSAKYRLIFEELFFMQLKMALLREENKERVKGSKFLIKKDNIVDKFITNLPFKLTEGQKNALNEIFYDMSQEKPMQRLLQGDVGCGKTVVACAALLAAVENSYQGAIMAPTEILAEQHFKNFSKWLTPLGLKVGLFLGRHGSKIRRQLLQDLKNGQIHIAIGTHALIQEGVEFNNLGISIIDEQHRFGVKQRSELISKGTNPEVLTMTATPIPRTLALCVHGELDITTIEDMPEGRKPIKTYLVTGRERRQAHDMILKEIEKGNQAYIVFPLIDESETLSAKAATKEAEKLQKGVFLKLKVGLVHGKMPPKDKDKVMEDFRKKKYDILVSTTVVEVGVDVPDATVMIIENAERFGLSQLHQLRGRVGRSEKQSYCILISESLSPETRERLEIMTKTNNGFVIAEADLKLRGPGEFMGTKQSGIPDLVLANISEHADILEKAREAAFECVKSSSDEELNTLKDYVYKDLNSSKDFIVAG